MENFKISPLLKGLGLDYSDLTLLFKAMKVYGHSFSASYRQIGSNVGTTYENVRYHFKKLEKLGFISLECSSTRRTVCRINMEKLNEVFQ